MFNFSESDVLFHATQARQGEASSALKQGTPSASGALLPSDAGRRLPWNLDAIGCFTTSFVHDLRNPLSTICAGTEMLAGPDLTSANVKKLAGNIHLAALRMRELLSDLIRIVQGDPSVVRICDLREVVTAASDAALAAKKSRRVRILFHVPEGILLHILRSSVEQVFFNVIANAIEAMPHGGTIHVCARINLDSVLIAVEDTGLGIPDDVRDHLFEPFVASRKPEGLGLGLALARQTLRSLGGDIWIEPAAGARFVIRLPMNALSCSGSAGNGDDVLPVR